MIKGGFTMRFIATLLVLVSLIFSLAACGKSDNKAALDQALGQMKTQLEAMKDLPAEAKEAGVKASVDALKGQGGFSDSDIEYFEKELRKLYGL
jgi:uncharacterized membrane protein